MRFEPARRHPLAFAVAAFLVMAPTLVLIALSLIGHELGLTAVAVGDRPDHRVGRPSRASSTSRWWQPR